MINLKTTMEDSAQEAITKINFLHVSVYMHKYMKTGVSLVHHYSGSIPMVSH